MKKFFSIITVLVLCVCFAAALASCEEKPAPVNTTDPTSASTVTTSPSSASTSQTTESTIVTETSETTPTSTTETTSTTLPDLKTFKVTLKKSDGFATPDEELLVSETESAVFDLPMKRGYTFVSCSDPSAVYSDGKLTIEKVTSDMTVTVSAFTLKDYEFKLNYPSKSVAKVTATTQNGYSVGQYSDDDTPEEAMGRYYVYDGEVLTLTATPADGYKFIGWSENGYAAEGGKIVESNAVIQLAPSTDERFARRTYSIYANFESIAPIKVTYHGNGGITPRGRNTYITASYSAVYNYSPTLGSALFDTFIYDGYFPIEYNTRADGKGFPVSIGSRATINKDSVDLYVIWEKISSASDFDYDIVNDEIHITGYSGTDATVVIPYEIEDMPVTYIGEFAFSDNYNIKKIVITNSVKTVSQRAFSNLSSLETVYLCDSVETISDSSFENCPEFANLRMIGVLDPVCSADPSNAFLQKYELLFKYGKIFDAEGKKINNLAVFVGGSATDTSIDASVIKAALNSKYIPVNLGTSSDISSILVSDIVSDLIDSGDIMVMIPELFGINPVTTADTVFTPEAWESFESCYDVLRHIDIRNYRNVFSSYSEMTSDTAKILRNEREIAKTYECFAKIETDLSDFVSVVLSHGAAYDEYGCRTDIRTATDTAKATVKLSARSELLPDYVASAINRIVDKCTQRKSVLLFSFCPIASSAVGFTNNDYLNFFSYVSGSLHTGMIASPFEFIFDDELTCDVAIHLSNEGAKEYSAIIGRELWTFIENAGTNPSPEGTD